MVSARYAVELASPYSPAECAARLEASVDSPWRLFGGRPVVGSMSGDEFSGRKRSYLVRNSWRPYIFARLLPDGRGSRIAVRFGISPFTSVFMIFWLAGVALITAAGLALLVRDRLSGVSDPGWFVPLGGV